MNSKFWDQLDAVHSRFISLFEKVGKEVSHESYDYFFDKHGWINRAWTSETFRLAHINVVDARQTKGLWMLHCCIFPHIDNPAPIFGFDIIASRHKVTGCFHDFSATQDKNHPMLSEFGQLVSELEWKRERKLPEWAETIFSPYIVAAGNLSNEDELDQLFSMVSETLPFYLQAVGETNKTGNSKIEQNFYCQQQKLNPHNSRAMLNLGLSNDEVTRFINDCMFPEIK